MAKDKPVERISGNPTKSGNLDGPENVQIPITGHKLNGNNYVQWSQSVKMFICGRGKDEYLTNEIVPPKPDDPKYRTWKIQNNLVMSWLVNSMTNEIEIFEIEAGLHDLRKGDLTVTQYFGILSRHWQRLDILEEHQWECPKDAKKYKEIIERKRIFKFFMGLNKSVDEVRGRILGMKPLPSIREAFSEVRKEESRRKVMLGDTPSVPIVDQSLALAARGTQRQENWTKKGRPWCDHCRKSGHTRDNYWKIHGKPADWKSSKNGYEGRDNHTMAEEGIHALKPKPFTTEQLEVLQKMFSQQTMNPNTIGIGSVAQKVLYLLNPQSYGL
ncbi:hypothetical protein CDL12_09191 [Handroanthus impetiginosus]|uniref:Retrotransposon Copia-like N-terminal domain-containing protein n=1 Tax=Handroanthus impetiginosus TaxID=429701 RepID=A0A2G9HL36_9LAMI|nr:hypothetical protein CDL12_09191 [Handroanthus impetiginosus]